MKIEIPGYKELNLRYLVLDYNGTIAMGGKIKESVKERIRKLAEEMDIIVLTADTYGTAKEAWSGSSGQDPDFSKRKCLAGKNGSGRRAGVRCLCGHWEWKE